MNKEIWKPIPGFDGYEVSDQGRVQSFKKKGKTWFISDIPQKILRHATTSGYHGVRLSNNGECYFLRIHYLVMLAFVGPRPEGLCICHYNGNPADNRLSNLRYDTLAGNGADTRRYNNALSDDTVVKIRKLRAAGKSSSAIARDFTLPLKKVYDIITGRIYESVGGPRYTDSISGAEVLCIRQLRQSGLSLNKISQRYNIDASTVSYLVRGKRRKSVGGPIEGIDYPIVSPIFHESGKRGAAILHGRPDEN